VKEKIFAEIGIGNETFLSTEIEKGCSEKRVKGFFVPKKIDNLYFRFWAFRFVLIISTKGIKTMKKKKSKFKLLFGVGGEN